MRPARPRPSLALSTLAVAAFGLLAVPVTTPAVAPAQTPALAVGLCDAAGNLEAALGERFGGLWADAATQQYRIGIIDRADEPAARAVVEACDVQDAANGVPAQHLRAPGAAYVVVQTPYPAVERAQQALAAWQSSPAGLPLSPRIVSHGIGLGDGDPNVDGFVGMVLRITLHLDTTGAELALIEAAADEIAAAHGVTVEIADERSDYAVPLVGLPGPIPQQPQQPQPPVAGPPAAGAPSHPSILSRKAVSRRATLRTRRLPVRLRVAETGRLRVTVRTDDRRRTVIARGTAAPKGAGRLTVRTNLTASGRAKLRKARRTRVVITVKQTGQQAVTRRIAVR